MNITRETAEDKLTATIKIEMQKADYSANVDKILKDYQKRANMPGFRPGKVPFSLISKMYRSAVTADEVNKLVSEQLSKYIADNDMHILGSPMNSIDKQEQIDFDVMENFDFYFDVALEPQFDVTFDGLKPVTRYEILIGEDMVKKYVDDTRMRMGKDIEPETVEAGDNLFGQFIQLDGDKNVLENGITHSASISVNKIEDEENRKKFIGMKQGDTIIFNPMEYFNDENAVARMLDINVNIAKNMKSEFSYTIDRITRRVPAEITEEFFDKVFPNGNIHSMAEFEDKIRNDAKVSFSSETDKKFMNDCIDVLVEKYNFPLPEEFMKRWILSRQDENDKNSITKEELDADFEEKYAKSIRWQVIENLIVKQNQLNVTKDDVRKHLISLFIGQTGMDAEDKESEQRAATFVDDFMSKEENLEQINSVYEHLMEANIIKLFGDKMQIETKETSYMDFIKILYPVPETPAEDKPAEEKPAETENK